MKRREEKEPLLNVLARGVGRAAGKVTAATQGLMVKAAELRENSGSRTKGPRAKVEGTAGRSTAGGRAKKSQGKRATGGLATKPKKKSVKSARSRAAR